MDPISIVTSVLSVASVGTKLSITLFNFAQGLGSAGKDIQMVAGELALFGQTLGLVHQSLDEVVKEHATISSVLSKVTHLIAPLNVQCDLVYSEVEGLMESLKPIKEEGSWTKRMKAQLSKIRWMFQKSRADVVQGLVQNLKGTLSCLLSIISVELARSRKKDPEIIERLEMEKQALIKVVETQSKKLDEALKAAQAKKEEISHLSESSVLTLASIAYTPPRLDTSSQVAVLQLARAEPSTPFPDQFHQYVGADHVGERTESYANSFTGESHGQGSLSTSSVTPKTSTEPKAKPHQKPQPAPEEKVICELGCGQHILRSEKQRHLAQHGQVRATHDYWSRNPNMLSFVRAEVISSVTEPSPQWFINHCIPISDTWLHGELNGKRGYFPTDRVEYIIPPAGYVQARAEVAKAEAQTESKVEAKPTFKQRFNFGKKKTDKTDEKKGTERWFGDAKYVMHESGIAFDTADAIPMSISEADLRGLSKSPNPGS